MEETENTVTARVLWFNEAKGYGLVRAEKVDLDDIRVEAGVLDDIESPILRDMLVEVTYVEDLTGPVARKLILSSAS